MASRRTLPPGVTKHIGDNDVPYWQVRISIGTRGNRTQPKRKFDTEGAALEYYDEHRSQKRQGVTALTSKITVEQACADWLAGKRVGKNTLSAYETSLQPVRDRHGGMLLTELDKGHLDKLVTALLAGTCMRADGERRFRTWKPVTINVMLRHITTMLESYRNQGKLVRNVGVLVDRIGGAKYQQSETYNETEIAQLLAVADEDRKGHTWHLSLCGLRRGEVAGLRWGDIDFEAETLTITPGHVRISAAGTAEDSDPKTEAGGRTLPLTPELVKMLKAAKKRRAEEKLKAGARYDDSVDYVVCNKYGEPYHPDTLTDHWLAICRKAGVKRIRLHDARHTCGTVMALQGVPPIVIAAWLGHVDATFTMRTYVNIKAAPLDQARTAMQAATARKAATS